MTLFTWLDSKVKTLRWYDISATKLSALFFGLFVAKLWPPILSLEWWWYAVLFILLGIVPLKNMFKK